MRLLMIAHYVIMAVGATALPLPRLSGRFGTSPEGIDEAGRGNLSIHGRNGRFFQQLSSDHMGLTP
jgi:hypothetical protein